MSILSMAFLLIAISAYIFGATVYYVNVAKPPPWLQQSKYGDAIDFLMSLFWPISAAAICGLIIFEKIGGKFGLD